MANVDEQAWLQRTARSLAAVADWEQWTNTLHNPERNSALFYDDRLCPTFPTSTAAYHGISSAVDHLGLVKDAIEATNTTRPYGYFTLARAAMFAAARSIWILHPQYRKQRQIRALWVDWESNQKHRQMVLATRSAGDGPPSDAVESMLASIERRRDLLAAAAKEIGEKLSSNRRGPIRFLRGPIGGGALSRSSVPAVLEVAKPHRSERRGRASGCWGGSLTADVLFTVRLPADATHTPAAPITSRPLVPSGAGQGWVADQSRSDAKRT